MIAMIGGGQPVRLDANGTPQIGAGYDIEKFGERYIPIYYPGTTDPQAASPVIVHPGSDFTGVNFIIPRGTPRKVRGIAVDAAIGQPVRTAAVTLVSRAASTIGSLAARPASEGVFEFQSVFPPPGEVTLAS
jgi:hypothetical protein